jgi:hypothetical protein
MNRSAPVISAAALTIVASLFGAGYIYRENLAFCLRTGHFSPIRIIESLAAPVDVAEFTPAGLRTVDGSWISLPGASGIEPPPAVLRDVKKYGVELAPDGSVSALVRVHRSCGNDPVRFHLARVDLSSLLLLIGPGGDHGVTEYGIDPGMVSQARIPFKGAG